MGGQRNRAPKYNCKDPLYIWGDITYYEGMSTPQRTLDTTEECQTGLEATEMRMKTPRIYYAYFIAVPVNPCMGQRVCFKSYLSHCNSSALGSKDSAHGSSNAEGNTGTSTPQPGGGGGDHQR